MLTEITHHQDGTQTVVKRTEHVLCVKHYTESRNHSDTLDYTDMRSTACAEALIYVGRTWRTEDRWEMGWVENGPVPMASRFRWVDCTDLFVWRGCPAHMIEVDGDPDTCSMLCELGHDDCRSCSELGHACWMLRHAEMLEDLAAWREHQHQAKMSSDMKAVAYAFGRTFDAIEAERTEPRKGRTLRVVKGRKVAKGTEGTCIWIGDGTYGTRVGIKDATGTVHWTAASNTIAI